MKKLICVILCAALLALCACSAGEGTSPDSTSEPFTLTDSQVAVVYDNTVYAINTKAESLISVLGEATSYEEADSCAYDGLDKYYYYENSDGLFTTLFTIPLLDGEDTICQIETNDPAFSTAAGISAGSTFSDVISAYGEDYTTDGNIYYYWAGEKNLPETPHIYFIIENDVVTALSIYSARNFG